MIRPGRQSGGSQCGQFLHTKTCGKVLMDTTDLSKARDRAISQIAEQRPDHLRILNPTPYKVSVSEKLYDRLHNLWLESSPVTEL